MVIVMMRAMPVNSFRTVAVETEQLIVLFGPTARLETRPGLLAGDAARLVTAPVDVIERQKFNARFAATGALTGISGNAFELRRAVAREFLLREGYTVCPSVVLVIPPQFFGVIGDPAFARRPLAMFDMELRARLPAHGPPSPPA